MTNNIYYQLEQEAKSFDGDQRLFWGEKMSLFSRELKGLSFSVLQEYIDLLEFCGKKFCGLMTGDDKC